MKEILKAVVLFGFIVGVGIFSVEAPEGHASDIFGSTETISEVQQPSLLQAAMQITGTSVFTVHLPTILKVADPNFIRPALRIVEVVYDPAEGADLDGERVIIENIGNQPVDLFEWSLHDAADTSYTFPEFTLAAQTMVTVWVKAGEDDAENLYWGRSSAVWNNDEDVATLRDQAGRLIDEYRYSSATPTPTTTPTLTGTIVPSMTVTAQPTISGGLPAINIVHVEFDPTDAESGEFVTLRNDDAVAVELTDWTLRDAADNSFTFPDFTLQAGDVVNVWVLTGTNDAENLYWGLSRPVWNNTGDTATLSDNAGNLVDSYTYPEATPTMPASTATATPEASQTITTTSTPTPASGSPTGTAEATETATPHSTLTPDLSEVSIIHVEADPTDAEAGEYVTLRNELTSAITLTGWTLSDAAENTFTIPTFTLQAGAMVNVWVLTGTNDAENLYWGRSSAVWNNSGDTATLSDSDGSVVDSYTYPEATMTPTPPSPTGTVTGTPEATETATPQPTIDPNAPDIKIIHVEADPTDAEAGEYVTLRNDETSAVELTGWILRDAADTTFTVPTFTLQAGAMVNVWVLTGTNDAENLYWGRSSAVWNNSGDTATLSDSNGNVVDIYTYPDNTETPTPSASPTSTPTLPPSSVNVKIIYIEYDPDGSDIEGEYVEIQNLESSTVDMTGWQLYDAADTSFTFPDFTLAAQGSVKVWVGEGVSDASNLYWGKTNIAVWNNSSETGDTATLVDADNRLVDTCSYLGGGVGHTCE